MKRTVADLIQLLQLYPQHLRVVVLGYESGYDDIRDLEVSSIQIGAASDPRRLFGQHKDMEYQGGELPVEDALIIK